jgi:hypothetical protein
MFQNCLAVFSEIFNKKKYNNGIRCTHTATKYEYGSVNDIKKPASKGITLNCIESVFISLY